MARLIRFFLVVVGILFLSHYAIAQVQLVNAFPNLTFSQPVFVTHANDGTNRIFVVQQTGQIRVFPNDSTVTSATTFLDLSSRISCCGERGLLGLAFHPNYATNGYFYVNYTQAGNGRTIVARYRVNPGNPNQGDFNSELILLNIYQPFSNHNGGMVMFGLDGYLYIGMGDGGSGGDPGNRAQNLDSLLGKLLRIDVDVASGGNNYGIPPDNPYVGNPFGWREEIYASGLRNPWRFSQDPVTGEIWLGDVGQNEVEEIDLIGSGLNYGWRCYEGDSTYNLSGCGPPSLYTFPVKTYLHSLGCSVTGGYIYRGYRRPDHVGRYIYGDYCSGRIWQFRYQGGVLTSDSLLVVASSISSFGVDQNGELYICNHAGSIWRFAGNPIYVGTTQVSPVNGSRHLAIPTQLKWRSASGAINYWLEVATDQNFSSLILRDSTLVDTVSTLSNLNEGIRYFWRLRVKNATGWGNYSSVWNFTTAFIPGQINLAEPPDLSNVPSQVVTFRWRGDPGATAYWLEAGFDSAFGSVTRRDTMLTDTSLITNDSLLDTVYYWRVRGTSPAGYGLFSDVWKYTTYSLPAQPVLVSPPDSSIQRYDSVLFVWRSIPDIFNYWFELSLDQNFSTFEVRDTTLIDTSTLVLNLPYNEWHYWRVRAKNRGGYGLFSSVGRFFAQEFLSVGDKDRVPKTFMLYQNYPNPFNPLTQISYDLPRQSFVRLSVSNLLGQEISVLVHGWKQEGRHSVDFDASGLSSGVYFYRLEARPADVGQTEDFRSVRKMVLMR